MQGPNVAVVDPALEGIKEKRFYDKTIFVVLRQFCRNKTALFGAVIVLLLVFMAIFAPLLAQYDYATVDPKNAALLPSAEHWLGTDAYGRDMFSRICYGARYSIILGVGSEFLALFVAIIVGTIAGYFGGFLENAILRVCDVLQSIPEVLLCICISQALGSGFVPTMIALSVGSIPGQARVLRATILSVREQEFIEAARASDCSNFRIMFVHILPNSLAPLIIGTSMGIGGKIMASAGLSYLGLGIQEPLPEWGAMIAAGRGYLRYSPHLVIIPGIFVALIVLAFNMIGDGLRDALDPKLRS